MYVCCTHTFVRLSIYESVRAVIGDNTVAKRRWRQLSEAGITVHVPNNNLQRENASVIVHVLTQKLWPH